MFGIVLVSIVLLLLSMSFAELFPVVIMFATVPFLRPLLLQAVQFFVALLEEGVEFSGYNQRVHDTIELAVAILLEAVEV